MYRNVVWKTGGQTPPPRRGLTAAERSAGRMRITDPAPTLTEQTLTPDQEQGLQQILDWEQTDDPCFTLSGYAGTGKTTVIQHYLKFTETEAALVGEVLHAQRVLTAPTNKAVRVLDEMASAHGLSVPCLTVHKLLGMKMKSDSEQKYCLAEGDSQIVGLKVVVVDECSMIGNRPTPTRHGDIPGLYDQLRSAAQRWRVKLLFVGDPAQLPPINEGKLSPTFEHKGAFLSKIVRQAEGNPIIRLATWVREQLNHNDIERPDLDTDGFCGVQLLQSKKDFEDLVREAYLDDPNHATKYKALAFRRGRVRGLNDAVRLALHGPDADAYHIGDRYVATAPVLDWPDGEKFPKVLASTDEDALLLSMEPTKCHDLPQYEALMLTLKNEARVFPATVVHPKDEARLESTLENMAAMARQRRLPWRDYWRHHDAFARLQPHWAMTTHRAQGSTYGATFVDAKDILSHPSGRFESLRCLYTAITRASEMVYLYEGK